jgi:DNA-binding CsgD family transcriptional regulator
MNGNDVLESVFNSGDGVFAVDQEQRIIFWNQGAEAILGYSAEEVMAEPCFQVIRGMDEWGCVICSQSCPLIGCARPGELACGQNLLTRAKDSSPRWLSMTHILPITVNHHPAVIVHVFRDITPELEAKRLVERIGEQLAGYRFIRSRAKDEAAPDIVLTDREKQVLSLLALGDGTAAIAKKLTISNTTARNHIQNLLAKLGVHTRLEAVAYARRHQLASTET